MLANIVKTLNRFAEKGMSALKRQGVNDYRDDFEVHVDLTNLKKALEQRRHFCSVNYFESLDSSVENFQNDTSAVLVSMHRTDGVPYVSMQPSPNALESASGMIIDYGDEKPAKVWLALSTSAGKSYSWFRNDGFIVGLY